jgi:hypothetical protein
LARPPRQQPPLPGCPHARDRRDGSQSKIEHPWGRRRACGHPAAPEGFDPARHHLAHPGAATPDSSTTGAGPVVSTRPASVRLGAPSPTPHTRDAPHPPVPASRRVPPGSHRSSRCGRVALAQLPNPVVARTAVPDAGARPTSTSPSLPGAHATILWSRSSTPRVSTGSRLAHNGTCSSTGPGGQSEHLAAHPPDRSSSPALATAEPQRAKRRPARRSTGGHAPTRARTRG